MAEATSAELKVKLAAMQKELDATEAAEAEAAAHPREPQVIFGDFMRAVSGILGNHPKLEKLVTELETVMAENAAAAPAADKAAA
jgi:hypothetical protein